VAIIRVRALVEQTLDRADVALPRGVTQAAATPPPSCALHRLLLPDSNGGSGGGSNDERAPGSSFYRRCSVWGM